MHRFGCFVSWMTGIAQKDATPASAEDQGCAESSGAATHDNYIEHEHESHRADHLVFAAISDFALGGELAVEHANLENTS